MAPLPTPSTAKIVRSDLKILLAKSAVSLEDALSPISIFMHIHDNDLHDNDQFGVLGLGLELGTASTHD